MKHRPSHCLARARCRLWPLWLLIVCASCIQSPAPRRPRHGPLHRSVEIELAALAAPAVSKPAAAKPPAPKLPPAVPPLAQCRADVDAQIDALISHPAQRPVLACNLVGYVAVQPDTETYAHALERITRRVAQAHPRGKPLLVVWLLSQSPGLGHARRALALEAGAFVARRGSAHTEWALVSFGHRPHLRVAPSPDPTRVQRGMLNVRADSETNSDLLGALQFVHTTLVAPERRRAVVIALVGAPVTESKRLAVTIAKMRSRETQVFVLGPEANFSSPLVWTPGFDEDGCATASDWVVVGSDSAEAELLPYDWLFNGNLDNIRSGFSPYTHAYLAHRTRGCDFPIALTPSRYDQDALRKDYAPELISAEEYRERRENSPVRRELYVITREWAGRHRVSCWFDRMDRLDDDARKWVAKARASHKWVRQAQRLLGQVRKPDPWRPKRWDAHRLLTIAQLAKMEFLYRQYWITLEGALHNGWPAPKPGVRFNYFALDWAKGTAHPPGGEDGRAELTEAIRRFDEVIKAHPHTPWAALAERDIKSLRPFVLKCGYYKGAEHHVEL